MPDRFDFASDNTAPICPEAWTELEAANSGDAPSYGEDRWTRAVCERVREIFETECEVFFVFNGTAANALALAQLGPSFHSVFCHELAHIETDECGAPEFFSGGSKLIPTRGDNGKLDLAQVVEAMARQRELHSPKPGVLSITQATELGTVYSIAELQTLGDFARRHELHLHMDGARFANAVASLGCAPKEITWQAGVEALSLGGTKNGTGAGEIVVFFQKERAREFDYRAKQAGHLASKMRYLAAPWLGLLSNEVWLKNARRANAAAQNLGQRLVSAAGLELAFPCQANAVFLRLPETLVAQLHERGWHFYKFIEPDIYRLMCSWAVNEKAIEEFVRDAAELSAI